MTHRRGQSDDRRRRVLTEDAVGQRRKSTIDKEVTKADGARYDPQVLDRQLRLSDIVPRAIWIHVFLFSVAFAVVVGLTVMHRVSLEHPSAGESVFRLEMAGSLASWFSSITLFSAAGIALICYSLRRHDQSDYHNQYRVWLWSAVLAVLLSLTASSSWHEAAGAQLAHYTGVGQSTAGFYWWFFPCISIAAVTAFRMLFELSASRLATTGVLGTMAAYSVVLGSQFGFNGGLEPATVTLAVESCWIAGHLLMLCSFLWYARHTILDVQGLIATRPAASSHKKRKKKSKAAANADMSYQRRDAKHTTLPALKKNRSDVEPDMPPTKQSTRLLEAAKLEQERFEDEDERLAKRPSRKRQQKPSPDTHQSDEDIRKMSKSERKRLRKLKAQQRRAA